MAEGQRHRPKTVTGLRLLPWLHERQRSDRHSVAHLADCVSCKEMNTAESRQYMACAYEPPVDGAVAWVHPGFDTGRATPEHPRGVFAPTVCPGYLSKLPEVIETSRLRAHWKVGAIVPACEGAPTKQQMDAILILDGECSAMEVWTMTPASKGGGRAD